MTAILNFRQSRRQDKIRGASRHEAISKGNQMIYLVCSGILVILFAFLSLQVSMTRGRTQTGIGPGDDPSGPLSKAVRAQGNAAEYIPLFVALFLYFMTSVAGAWITWVVVIVTICRVRHAAGMLMTRSFNAKPHPLRAIGALGTYVGAIALGIALLMRAFL